MSDGRRNRRPRASLEPQPLGVNAPSDYRQKRHAAHRRFLVLSCRPGIGRGGSLLGVPSAKTCNAAVRDSDRGGSSLQGFSLPGRYVLRATVGPFWGGWTRLELRASREEPETVKSVLAVAGGNV